MFFRVINGPQSGAAFALEFDKEYIVANDLNADIYLRQTKEHDITFTFMVSNEGVTFTTLSNDIYNHVNDELIKTLELYQVPLMITIGDNLIAFSEGKNEPLNEQVNEQLDQSLTESGSRELEELEGDQDLFNEPITSEDDFLHDVFNSTHNPDNPDGTNNTSFTQEKIKSRLNIFNKVLSFIKVNIQKFWNLLYARLGKNAYLILVAIIIVISGAILIIYEANQQQHIETNLSNMILQKKDIEKLLAELPMPYSNLKLEEQGNLFIIRGIVESQSLLNEMRTKLKHYSNINYKVIVFDNIKKSIIEIIAQNKIVNAQVNYKPDHGIMISGITDNFENVNNLEIAIDNKFNYTSQLDINDIFVIKDIDDFINKAINEVKDQVSIEKNYTLGKITINGYLSRNQLAELTQQINQFNQLHRGVLVIHLNVKDVLKAIPFYIKVVYTGSPPWIMTSDGTKIYIDGSYKGITLLGVTANKLTFKTNFTFTLSMDELTSLDVTSKVSSFNHQALKGNDSNNGINETNNNCDRKCILDEERKRESLVIAQQKRQLRALETIIKKTSDKHLKSELQYTFNNIKEDLQQHEQEFNFYNKTSL